MSSPDQSSMDQLVHPIYRYIWPTPQSIFFPVSHRIPSKEALIAQLYSTTLFRYVHIDSRSNAMRTRHGDSRQAKSYTHRKQETAANITSATGESTTTATTDKPIRGGMNKSRQLLKFTPSPQFPFNALALLLWYHLGMCRYPSTAAGLDLDSYSQHLDSEWSVTKVYEPVLATPGTALISSTPLVSEIGIREITDGIEQIIDRQHISPISSNNPLAIAPIPSSHRQQLHTQFQSGPDDRILYPFFDEHRTPLPLRESTFLRHTQHEPNQYQSKSLVGVPYEIAGGTGQIPPHQQPPQTEGGTITTTSVQDIIIGTIADGVNLGSDDDGATKGKEVLDILNSVHSILKQHLPVVDRQNNTSTVHNQDPSSPSDDSSHDITRTNQQSRGSRSVVLKHPDAAGYIQDRQQKQLEKAQRQQELGKGDSATTLTPSPTMAITPTPHAKFQPINPAWNQTLVNKTVRGLHVKHKARLMKTSQYLVFGSKLLLQRHLAKEKRKAINIFPPKSTPGTNTHQTRAANAFFDIMMSVLDNINSPMSTTTQTEPPIVTNNIKIVPKSRNSLTPSQQRERQETLIKLITPSYDAFNSNDQFKIDNCVYDKENNTVGPELLIGDVSPSITPVIHHGKLAPTQPTPSSVIVSCSPEKPEVWGTMMFAIALLNAKIIQNQMTTPFTTSGPDTHPILPHINHTQPNTLAVEHRLISLLHKHYNVVNQQQSIQHTNQDPSPLEQEYNTLIQALPNAVSFYDKDIYSYLANGLQSPTNTFYLPSPSDIGHLIRAHQAMVDLRNELVIKTRSITPINNDNDNCDLTISWPQLQEQFHLLTQPIPPSIQQLYLNILTHSVPYPLSTSPTSPQTLFHFAFDTDAAPYCYVPKVIQGVFSPLSTRPTLLEHQQLSISRSFKRKNQISIEQPTTTETSELPLVASNPTSGQENMSTKDPVGIGAGDKEGLVPATSTVLTATPSSSNLNSPPSTTSQPPLSPTPTTPSYPQLPLGDVSFNLLWTWRHSTINHQYLHCFQKVNHFQRSGHLTRKDALSKNIMRFTKAFAVYDQQAVAKANKTRLVAKGGDDTTPQSAQSVQTDDSRDKTATSRTKPSLPSRYGENLEILPHSYVFPLDLKQFSAEYESRQHNCLECSGSGRVPKVNQDSSITMTTTTTRTDSATTDNTTTRPQEQTLTITPTQGDSTPHPQPDSNTQPCSCQLWIIKPVNSSRGRGIFISDDIATFAQPYINFYDGVSFQGLYGTPQQQQQQQQQQPPKSPSNSGNLPSLTRGLSTDTKTNVTDGTKSPPTVNQDETMNNNDKVFKYAETTDYPPVVVQHYINNPLLLHRRKFDLRIYVLVVSFEPLEAYIYNDGYARFAGSEFSPDISNLHGHLTNSSLNLDVVQTASKNDKEKNSQSGPVQESTTVAMSDMSSESDSAPPTPTPITSRCNSGTSHPSLDISQESDFSKDFHKSHSVPNPTFAPSVLEPATGTNTPTFDNCKQLFSEWLLDMTETFGPEAHANWEKKYGTTTTPQGNIPTQSTNPIPPRPSKQPLDTVQLLRDIDRTILNSLIIVSQRVGPQSNAFEVFGYDIMIDDDFRPWLLEVNSSPSLNLNTDIDTLVKPQLLADTISLLGLLPYDRTVLSGMIGGLRTVAQEQTTTPWNFVKAAPGFTGGSMLHDETNDKLASNPNDPSLQQGNIARSVKNDVSNNDTGKLNAKFDTTVPYDQDPINHTFSNLLANFRTRFYGELPVNIGNYRRLAPNGPSSVWKEQAVFRQLVRRFSLPGGLPNGMRLKPPQTPPATQTAQSSTNSDGFKQQ